MIIKNKDSTGARKLELELLKGFDLPYEKSFLVNEELKRFTSGEKGEKNTAYYLDFSIKDRKGLAIIHDLRLEYNGEVAQIDHLIITRLMQIYVLETKAYGDMLEMKEDGSFLASYGEKKFGVSSPIEQNKRHIEILQKVLEESDLLPKRLGVKLPVEYLNYVLLDPKTNFIRPEKCSSSEVVKSDQFMTLICDKLDEVSIASAVKLISKVISPQSLKGIAEGLAALHKPTQTNYKERFNISDSDWKKHKAHHHPDHAPKAVKPTASSSNYCFKCRVTISSDVAQFCFNRKQQFNGKAFCRSCQ